MIMIGSLLVVLVISLTDMDLSPLHTVDLSNNSVPGSLAYEVPASCVDVDFEIKYVGFDDAEIKYGCIV